MKDKTDILIIGSGAAGLTAALELCDKFKVTIISKNQIVDSSTWYAQGGIAAVLAKEDSTKSHIEDTVATAKGLADENVIVKVVNEAKNVINDIHGQFLGQTSCCRTF